MVRKLASKNWMDRVQESAMYFIIGIDILAVGSIIFYFGGPPPRNSWSKIMAVALAVIIMAINHLIFMHKDRYKSILEYYDSKY